MYTYGTSSGKHMDTVEAFVEVHMSSGSTEREEEQEEKPIFVTQGLSSNLEYDVRRPELFNLCGSRDREYASLLLGPHRGRGPIQRSNASWHVVVVGTVTWTLWPPVGLTRMDTYIYGDNVDPTEIHGAGIKRKKRRGCTQRTRYTKRAVRA